MEDDLIENLREYEQNKGITQETPSDDVKQANIVSEGAATGTGEPLPYSDDGAFEAGDKPNTPSEASNIGNGTPVPAEYIDYSEIEVPDQYNFGTARQEESMEEHDSHATAQADTSAYTDYAPYSPQQPGTTYPAADTQPQGQTSTEQPAGYAARDHTGYTPYQPAQTYRPANQGSTVYKNRLAFAGMILGIVGIASSLLWLAIGGGGFLLLPLSIPISIVGIVLGAIGIHRSNEVGCGRGQGIAGLSCGILGTILATIQLVIIAGLVATAIGLVGISTIDNYPSVSNDIYDDAIEDITDDFWEDSYDGDYAEPFSDHYIQDYRDYRIIEDNPYVIDDDIDLDTMRVWSYRVMNEDGTETLIDSDGETIEIRTYEDGQLVSDESYEDTTDGLNLTELTSDLHKDGGTLSSDRSLVGPKIGGPIRYYITMP